MDKSIRVGLILAAGNSTRYNKGKDESECINKCVAKFNLDEKSYLTQLTANINSCMSAGIFNFIVVIGYKSDTVIAECDRLCRIYGNNIKIDYVDVSNHKDTNEYNSLVCGIKYAIEKSYKELYVLHGCNFIAPKFIERLVDCPYSSVLVRYSLVDLHEPEYYYAIMDKGEIVRYDRSTEFKEGEVISYPVFKILNDDDLLLNYKGGESTFDFMNELVNKYYTLPVWVHPTDGIYIINTHDDYNNMTNIFKII